MADDPYAALIPKKVESDPYAALIPAKPKTDAGQAAALAAVRGQTPGGLGGAALDTSGLLTRAQSARAREQGATGVRIASNVMSLPGDFAGAAARDVAATANMSPAEINAYGHPEMQRFLAALRGQGAPKGQTVDDRLQRLADEFYVTSPRELDALEKSGGALGTAAHLAKKYPLATQAADFVGEAALNPFNLVIPLGARGAGLLARGAGAAGRRVVAAAAERSPTIARAAEAAGNTARDTATQVATKVNAFHYPERMEKAGMTGAVGNARQFHAQGQLAEAHAEEEMRRIFGADGETNRAQQIEIQHRVDGTKPNPNVPEPKTGMTIDQRAEAIRKINRAIAPQLKALGYKIEDPETFFSRAVYRHDRPVYKGETKDFTPEDFRPTGRFGGSLGVQNTGLREHRVFNTLQDALDAGLELDPKYTPAEQFRLSLAARLNLLGKEATLARAAEIPTGLTGTTQIVDQQIVPRYPGTKSKATKLVGGELASDRPLPVRVPYEYYDERNPNGVMLYGTGPAGEKAAQAAAHARARTIAEREVLARPDFASFGGRVPKRGSNATYLRGVIAGITKGGRPVANARFNQASDAIRNLSDTIAQREAAVADAREQNAYRAQRLKEIRSAIRFLGKENAEDYDRILRPYAEERLEHPAYQERGYFDPQTGEWRTRVPDAQRAVMDANPGKKFTGSDIAAAKAEIRQKLGKTVPSEQVEDALDRLHALGQQRWELEREAAQPAARVPAGVPADVKRAAAKVSRQTSAAVAGLDRAAKAARSDISALAARRAQAVQDRALRERYYAAVNKRLGEVEAHIFQTLEHEPRGVPKGTFLRESDLRLGTPSSTSHLLYRDYWEHIRQATRLGAPEDEAKAVMRFIAATGAMARVGVIVWPVVHGVWNLGKAFLEEGGDIREMTRILTGRSNAAATVIPEHLTTRYAAKYGARPGMTWGELADEIGASGAGGARGLGLSRESRGAIATLPGEELSPVGQLEQGLTRGISDRNTGRKITPGWDRNNDLVFKTWERNYVADRLKAHIEAGEEPGMAARRIRKAFGDYANITPAERQAGLTSLLYFYPWMKTVLPYWTARGVFNPASWNAPTRSIRTENELQGDTTETNPWTEAFGKTDTGDWRVATIPDPARVTTGVMDAAMAPIDALRGKPIPTSASPNARVKKVEGLGAVRRDLTPLGNWARGHAGALPALSLDALVPSGPYNRLADENAPVDLQAQQIAARVGEGLIAPLRTLGTISADPGFALGATALGGYPRVELSQAHQERQREIRALMAQAKRDHNMSLYRFYERELNDVGKAPARKAPLALPSPAPTASADDPYAALIPATAR